MGNCENLKQIVLLHTTTMQNCVQACQSVPSTRIVIDQLKKELEEERCVRIDALLTASWVGWTANL